jgi:penicillin-binding protein 2
VPLPLHERTETHIHSKPGLRDDVKFAAGRIAFFQYLSVGIFLFLISGFWMLQVRDPEYYQEAAERNRIKFVPLLAPRGKILDRDGRVIVDNRSSYSVLMSRDRMKNAHVRPIAEGLGLDPGQLELRVSRFRSRPKYEDILIKNELTPGEVAFVEAHRDPDTFPELELIRAQRRLYPQSGLAAHVIGYVGEISENELDLPEFINYNQGAVIGKAGLEREYNDQLMGVDGRRQVIVDNRGNVRGEPLENKEAIPGKNLQLTLDLDLQVVAELGMEGRIGAVVALDPRNGEVLAMVSTPSYDPNRFAGRIRQEDWNQLRNNPDNPLLDRAIQAQFAPGSTFKPIVALAGLESGSIDDSFRVHCGGGASFYGTYFKCHEKKGHGTVDLHRGIAQSCDVFFYNVGNRTGIDNIAKYAEMAGVASKTGIDLPNEMQGTMPSTEWAMRTQRRKYYAGEVISVAIGQGAVTMTPLQLAHAIGGIAMGGVWYRPHLVKGTPEKPRIGKIDPANAQKIVAGMYGVVNEGGGTGVRARLPNISVCGKTGSAQRISNKAAKTSLGRTLKDNAWFVAFAPCEAPEVVVSVLWEAGEHGQFAAPIARDVLKAYFDKKVRLTRDQLVADIKRNAPGFGPVAPPLQPEPQTEP